MGVVHGFSHAVLFKEEGNGVIGVIDPDVYRLAILSFNRAVVISFRLYFGRIEGDRQHNEQGDGQDCQGAEVWSRVEHDQSPF